MITAAEYNRRWGGNVLRRPTAAALSDLHIPPLHKTFLRKVGFPHCSMFNVDFADVSRPLPRLSRCRSFELEYQQDLSRLRVIGNVWSSYRLCLDEAGNGRIVYVKGWEPGPEFLNTSVEKLALCLLAWVEVDRRLPQEGAYPTGRRLRERAKAFRAALSRIDPPALARGSVWPVKLGEIRYGLN